MKKQVMSIVTDSTPLEEPKDPDTCNVFAIYSLIADDTQIAVMRENYTGGNYGYGHAKKALLDLILVKYADERIRFAELMENPEQIEAALQKGAEKARPVANAVIRRVRRKLGY